MTLKNKGKKCEVKTSVSYISRIWPDSGLQPLGEFWFVSLVNVIGCAKFYCY